MGLTDKGKVAPVSLAELGFSFDGGTLKRLGGRLTPGMSEAVTKFNRTAAELNLSPNDLRSRRRELYVQHQERIRAGRAETVLPEKSG
jgi:hypothetical protein